MITIVTDKRLDPIAEWCETNFKRSVPMSSDGATLLIYAYLSAGDLAQLQAALTDGSIGIQSWREIRAERDRLLAASDWTQSVDSPLALSQREAWGAYRQALRDVPSAFARPDDVVWPTPPTRAVPVVFSGVLCYTALDVDRVCQLQVYELLLPGQPETLQSLASMSVLSDVIAATFVLIDPSATPEQIQAAQLIIANNMQLKAAMDAIWETGQAFKQQQGW